MATRFVWAATDIGLVRKTNEDSYGLPGRISSGRARDAWNGRLSTDTGWAVIADGMGGHEAGEIASLAVVETFQRLAGRTQTEIGIKSVLEEANFQIYSRISSGAGRPGMGSTVVGLAFTPQQCFAFNIGDSRLYLRRETELLQLSIDDTLNTKGLGRSHALTQSLGGTRDPVPLFPHIKGWKAHREDIIVLCSDGLSDMLSGQQILEVLDGRHPQPALALVESAVAEGGRDNATAIVVGPEVF